MVVFCVDRSNSLSIIITLIILVSSSISKPVWSKSVPTLRNGKEYDEKKYQLIRKLSKESGLPQVHDNNNVCLDAGCLDAALDILSALNGSIDPCVDFFQFSCGRWLANNSAPGASSVGYKRNRFTLLNDRINNITQKILSEGENDTDAKPINQAKRFYKSCLDVGEIESAGMNSLFDAIAPLGGWQILNPEKWNSKPYDMFKAMAELRRRTSEPAVILTLVTADMKNTSRSVVYIDQPTFGLPRGMLIAPENYTAQVLAYAGSIMELAMELGSTQNDDDLQLSVDAIINFEIQLARISSSDEARYDMERLYNPFKLSEYQKVTDGVGNGFTIPWKRYLDQLFSSSGISISDNEDIIVREPDYIRKLIPILEATPIETISNYVVWRHLLKTLTAVSTGQLGRIALRLQKVMFGIAGPVPREVTCANSANAGFGMAIGVKYIEATFDEKAKTEVEDLVENLRSSFEEMVWMADWMDDITKTEAIRKADAIKTFMAYPDWLQNKTAVEEFYQGLELGDSHIQNALKLMEYSVYKELKVLRKPTDRNQWVFTPGEVNAGYYTVFNSITFPAGILQPTFFGKGRPKSQNYAGIGVIIGHEITHGFDNRGSQFDLFGNVNNWWDKSTKAEYDRRAKCMSKQYSNYYSKAAGKNLNGNLTLGENIADNGGLRESYRAYHKFIKEHGEEQKLPGLESLSTDQIFFLGYANVWCESITREGLINQILSDPHSPAEFRVKGPLQNSVEFAKAFSCPVDPDGMNPPEDQKCTVW